MYNKDWACNSTCTRATCTCMCGSGIHAADKKKYDIFIGCFRSLVLWQRRCIGHTVLLKLLHHDCSVQATTRAASGAPRPFHCFILSTTYTTNATKHTKYK